MSTPLLCLVAAIAALSAADESWPSNGTFTVVTDLCSTRGVCTVRGVCACMQGFSGHRCEVNEREQSGSIVPIFVAVVVSVTFGLLLLGVLLHQRLGRLAELHSVSRRALLNGLLHQIWRVMGHLWFALRLRVARRFCCRRLVASSGGTTAHARWVGEVRRAASTILSRGDIISTRNPRLLRRILAAANTAVSMQPIERYLAYESEMHVSELSELLILLACDLPHFRSLFAIHSTPDKAGGTNGSHTIPGSKSVRTTSKGKMSAQGFRGFFKLEQGPLDEHASAEAATAFKQGILLPVGWQEEASQSMKLSLIRQETRSLRASRAACTSRLSRFSTFSERSGENVLSVPHH